MSGLFAIKDEADFSIFCEDQLMCFLSSTWLSHEVKHVTIFFLCNIIWCRVFSNTKHYKKGDLYTLCVKCKTHVILAKPVNQINGVFCRLQDIVPMNVNFPYTDVQMKYLYDSFIILSFWTSWKTTQFSLIKFIKIIKKTNMFISMEFRVRIGPQENFIKLSTL